MRNDSFDSVFLDKAIQRGGLLLFNHADAMQLINLCKDKNIPILGIDAFFISDGYTHPVMEHSADFSRTALIDSFECASQFLESRKGLDLVYEIIY